MGRLIEPREKRGDDVAKLGEHLLRAALHFLERVREHAEQQGLERLAGAEEADVRGRRGRQQTAECVERFRANHRFVDAFGVFR